MDFKQLEAFTAVVEHGSFSEAARCLFLTQPTVSQHIKVLEDELGVRLVKRTTKNVEITSEGRRFYEYAVSILRLKSKAEGEFTRHEENVIHIGASTIPSAYILPEVITRYHVDHPETVFVVSQSDSGKIIRELEEGSIDIAIVGSVQVPASVTLRPIGGDSIVLCAPATDHFRALKESGACLERLLREPFIMRERGSGTKKEAQYLLDKLGIDESQLNVVAYMNDPEAIRRCIAGGLGVSLVSYLSVSEAAKKGEVLLFEPPAGSGGRNFYAALRKDMPLNRQLEVFTDFLSGFFEERK